MNTLLTLEEFRTFCPSSSLSDAQIEIYLNIATEVIHEYAGISLEEGEMTEILRGNNQNTLYVTKRPLTQILDIKSNFDTENIIINPAQNGIRRTSGVFYQGQDIEEPYMASQTSKSETILINYIGGYKYPSGEEKGNVPYSLKYAVCQLIESMISHEDGGTGNLKSYSRDDVSYTFQDKIETDKKFYSIINRFVAW